VLELHGGEAEINKQVTVLKTTNIQESPSVIFLTMYKSAETSLTDCPMSNGYILLGSSSLEGFLSDFLHVLSH
jgi:hypothetical protein